MNKPACRSSGSDKYSAVAGELRRRIAVGLIAPGSQLPPRSELEKVFGVSRVTLQRAMSLLIEDGFIHATRSKGSFVADRPPHLSRYALVFQAHPEKAANWSRFWMALESEAARRERRDDCAIPVFYGIDGHTDTADYRNIAREIGEYRVAGVMYVADYPRLPDISLLSSGKVPAAYISGPHEGVPPASEKPNAPFITVDEESFVHKALDLLHRHGRRRIAFVMPPEYLQRRGEYVERELAARGMETRPYWMQGVSLEAPFVARNCVHLLVNAAQSERPDALVITDDNLVESATVGLAAAGVSAPHEIEVVAHANFPWKTPCVVPAQRLGFDIRSLMSACLESIDGQRRGEPYPVAIPTLAQFEDELSV